MEAYAKLNLLLHVTGKNLSGYHNLQMVNCKINLCDYIYIKNNNLNIDTIKATNLTNYNTNDNNLILIVVKAFKNKYNINKGYDIEIEKHIPFGSGLGGVSMDVGEILKYIIKDNNINISLNELIEFTKSFGADIPYSFYNSPAIVEGIGETIKEVKLKSKEMILIIPDIYISTETIFKNVNKYNEVKSHFELIDKVNYGDRTNDLEIVARNIYKELDDYIFELSQYGKIVMSGSGSAFSLEPFEDIDQTIALIKQKYNSLRVMKIQTKEG